MARIIFILFMSMGCLVLTGQDIQIEPATPSWGDDISITYNAQEGILKGEEIHALIYSIELGEVPVVHEVTLNAGRARYTIPANAQSILIQFSNADETKIDKNEGLGYTSLIYDNGNPIKFANASLARVYTLTNRYLRLDKNIKEAKSRLDQELTVYPDAILSFDVYEVDLEIKKSLSSDLKDFNDQIMSKIEELRYKSEEGLYDATTLASRYNFDAIYVDLQNQATNSYPSGRLAIATRLENFRNKEGVDAKLKEYESIMKQISEDEYQDARFDYMRRLLAEAFGLEGDKDNYLKYLQLITSPTTKASSCNEVAWRFSGESLKGKSKYLEFAEEISKLSLVLVDDAKHNSKVKPEYFTEKRWHNNMEYLYAMFADTYALVAHKLGDKEAAVKYQRIAAEYNKFENADINTRYAVFLESTNGPEETLPFLEGAIAKGHASIEMKDQFKRLFAQVSNDVEGRIAELEGGLKKKHRDEILAKIIEGERLPFQLINLRGDSIGSEYLAGKVVVVDFWATWCGPCIASMPGMELAKSKFASQKDVEFLFINSWEVGKNKAQKVIDFVKENGFDFHVLLDLENKVITQYGVDGIPAKFVLDRSGRIRYQSGGYDGNNSMLVNEISTVVDYLLNE